LHLLMPELFLDADGLAFYRAHGLDKILKANGVVHFKWGDLLFKMSILSIAFPSRYLDAAGRAFYNSHDLDTLIRLNGTIKVMHRCDMLTDEGQCSIYASRPRACREFDCSTRGDCTADAQASDAAPSAPHLTLVH
jgi:Fe-S-cluster containining protein